MERCQPPCLTTEISTQPIRNDSLLESEAADCIGRYNPWLLGATMSMLIVIFLAGVFGNVLVCVSMYTCKSLRTVNNALLFNLAVADLLACFVYAPLLLTLVVQSLFFSDALMPRFVCIAQVWLRFVCGSVQQMTLCAISAQRYFAIVHPLKKTGIKERIIAAVIITWSLSICLSVPAIFLRSSPTYGLSPCSHVAGTATNLVDMYIFGPLGIICLLAVVVFYALIFRTVWKHVNEQKKNQEPSNEDKRTPVRRRFCVSCWGRLWGPGKIKRTNVVVPAQTNASQRTPNHDMLQCSSSVEPHERRNVWSENAGLETGHTELDKTDRIDDGLFNKLPNSPRHFLSLASTQESPYLQRLEPMDRPCTNHSVRVNISEARPEQKEDSFDIGSEMSPSKRTSVVLRVDEARNCNSNHSQDRHKDCISSEDSEGRIANSVDVAPQSVSASADDSGQNVVPNKTKSEDQEKRRSTLSITPQKGAWEARAVVSGELSPNSNVTPRNSIEKISSMGDLASQASNSPSANFKENVYVPDAGASEIVPDAPSKVFGDVCVMNPKIRERGRRKIEAKTAKRALFIVAAFVICWLPISIVTYLGRFIAIDVELAIFFMTMSVVSAVINPVIYTFINNAYRNEFKRLLKRAFRKR